MPPADRFGINVSDVQDAVETAVGGKAVSQILVREQRYDLPSATSRHSARRSKISRTYRILAPSGERVFAGTTLPVKLEDGASTIYREGIGATSPSSTACVDATWAARCDRQLRRCARRSNFPEGYYLDWTGEYESQQRANRRLAFIVPITILLMSFILYSAFDSWKWVALILGVVSLSPLGGFFSLLLTHTHFSVSSGLGFLAVIGVSVEIGVIMVEYINQLRTRGMNPREAAKEGASLRLRPIMMTMLVATSGASASRHVTRHRI